MDTSSGNTRRFYPSQQPQQNFVSEELFYMGEPTVDNFSFQNPFEENQYYQEENSEEPQYENLEFEQEIENEQ